MAKKKIKSIKKKIKIKDQLEEIYMEEKITVKNLISNLQEVENKYSSIGYKKLEIEPICNGYGEDSREEYWLSGTRLETDEEYKRRIKKEIKQEERNQKRKKIKKEKEIKELQKLIKKYPKEMSKLNENIILQ